MPKKANVQQDLDILLVGAGIVGLTLALELHVRGARVTVFDSHAALRQASYAAAGMLAIDDPHNPAALLPLSRLSGSLYPEFLTRLASLSGASVPFQTETTLRYLSDGRIQSLTEHSLDPRQLGAALLAAVRAVSIDLCENTGSLDIEETPEGVHVHAANGDERFAQRLVHTTGAWFAWRQVVRPRKGQMLRVQLPSALRLREVHRTEHAYIVPRTQGPQAGTALIGATVEDAGYDLTTHASDLARLRGLAAELVPALGSLTEAREVESWAGTRPGTPDDLPLLGALPGTARQFVATGHFRNGILLAPATAVVVGDLLEGKSLVLDLKPFAPTRFLT